MQDFSRKMTIVVRDDVGSWQLTNTIAHIAAYLGNKMSEPFDTGESFLSKDGKKFPRNSQYGIVALKATKTEIMELVEKLQNSNLLFLPYLQDMMDLGDDNELEKSIAAKDAKDTDILGVGIFGTKEELKTFTQKFKLWK